MKRRVVSLWLPNFATDRLTKRLDRRRPAKGGWQAKSLATVIAARGTLGIAAVNPAAEAVGIRPGLSLADARALVPGLTTFEADPTGDRGALERLAGWCGRYTPWIAVDEHAGGPGAGSLWLDISGCAHLFGGEAALLDDLAQRLRAFGFDARAAVADTPGAAWAVARFADAGATTVVPPGEARRVLAPLPVAGLRLSPVVVEALDRVGLGHIDDLATVARAPLAARFGAAPLRRLDQALGWTDEAISPRRPIEASRVRLAFAEPIGRIDDVAAALDRLLAELCTRLEKTSKGARRLELVLYRVDGTTANATIGTGRPVREVDHLKRLFAEKLGTLDVGFGVETITLAATATDPLSPVQVGLDGHGGTKERAAHLIDRLGNRLGAGDVVRLSPRASHIPERASHAVSALAQAPCGETVGEPGRRLPRPLHLLPSPEPIQVVAPVPDDPPAMFRWRRRQHRVAEAEGPERIGPEWWLEEPLAPASQQDRIRDYYRVEDSAGQRFWVYRDGPYRPGIRPRWYLHGFFA
jgi:protein ImuB